MVAYNEYTIGRTCGVSKTHKIYTAERNRAVKTLSKVRGVKWV